MKIEEQVLKLVKKTHPLSFGKLAKAIEGMGSKTELKNILQRLEQEGTLVKVGKTGYGLPEDLNYTTGRLQANKRGYGFVRGDKIDVYISPFAMNGAMHNDEVLVKLSKRKRKGGSIEGEVVKILKRANPTVVGKFERKGRDFFLTPSDARIFYKIHIPPKFSLGASLGDMVVAQIERWPNRRHGPVGRIIEILGEETSIGVEIEVIIREHRLPMVFPFNVLAECQEIPDEVLPQDLLGRKDYRDEFTVTIDGLDAKDFDDAVSIKRDELGNFLLKVHIADVSHHVDVNDALDAEAASRGFSTYLVDRVIPMLPPKLSNEICSLIPRVDRLSLSVEMLVDAKGKVRHFEIAEGVIRSDFRLTYEEVDELFITGEFENEEMRRCLSQLRELSNILEERRVKRGSINFETIEPKVILDEELKPVDVVIREKTPATMLIEETMILTNETVAGFMRWQGLPMIYRVHERPESEALTQIKELVEGLGYPIKGMRTIHPKTFQNIIAYAHKRSERLLINYLLLRAMKQARYSPICKPHFGLASDCYTHFTSPIRRYPDLVVHRMVKAVLKGEVSHPKILDLAKRLLDICEHCSIREREIDEAERDSVDLKLCELMEQHIGDVFKGIITGVTAYGLFVQIPNSAEGLIHIRDLTDDYYHYEPDRFLLRGQRTGKIFRLGQEVTIRVANVVIGERRIDFVPA
ncbi:MAG: ribonuclease R [Actinomycetota bacterium]